MFVKHSPDRVKLFHHTKESFMETRDTRYNAGSFPKSPVKTAAVPISIFVGLYLAAGGIVRVLDSPEATAAMVRHGSAEYSVGAPASYATAKPVERFASESAAQAPDRTDNSRECSPTEAVDSDCIYN